MVITRVVNIYKEPYDVYIGRGSPFGNPFIIGRDGTRAEVIEKYRRWLCSQPTLVARVKRELAGKTLGCYCHPLQCHGNVLKEIVDA